MNTPQPQALRRWTFFGAMAALVLVAMGSTAQLLWHERAQLIDRNFEVATLHAGAFEDHLTQTFNVIDLTLINTSENGAAAVTKNFSSALRQAPYLRSLALLDADGSIVASSNARNLGHKATLAGFVPPDTGSAELLRIGPPWSGRDFEDGVPSSAEHPVNADAPGFLPVSRGAILAGGIRATLLAAVSGDFFINHYSRVLNPADGTVDLLRSDGALLFSTSTAQTPGAMRSADLAATRLAKGQSGRFEQRLEDGREVLTAYRASRAFPFVLVVHLDKEQVLARWRHQATGILVVLIVVMLAAAALATRYYFWLERAAGMREASETRLLASEARYRNTFEHAAVGVSHASVDGRILHANPHLCDMLGYTLEEVTRLTIRDLTHPDDLAEDLARGKLLISGELANYRAEKRFVRKSGEAFWVSLAVSLVRDASGAGDYRVAVIENIHLRKLTGMALHALNTELTGDAFLQLMTKTLATLMGVEMVFIGEVGSSSKRCLNARVVFVDGQRVPDFSFDLQGSPCETVTGNQVCVYAEQVQQRFPDDRMLARMGIESFAAAPLGNATRLGASLGVLVILSRRPLRQLEAVQTLLPMLALRAGAELVREREAKKFRGLFDSSPGAVFLVDGQNTIHMSSLAGQHLFGWESDALIGEKLGVLFPEQYRDAYEARFRQFVQAQATVATSNKSTGMWGRRSDGSTFPAEVQLHMLETAEGRMAVAHVQDVTERKRAEANLQRDNEELENKVTARTVDLLRARDDAEAANRAKSAFLATMSHEIRTPMNGVVGMIDVLEQSNLKEAQAEIVKTVRESAYALLTIVDDVLDFSKIEAGQFQVDSEPMDVAAMVEAACDTLDHLAAKKGVELRLFTDPAIPALVLGDATRVRQVLLNLAGNAIKFSSGQECRGQVSVRASVVERDARQAVLEFSVADNGIGMDADALSRLFTPFSQADASTTRRFGGTGLGLSISHRLVELMGGEIRVQSEPGCGSTFTVRLPMAVPAALPGSDAADADKFDLRGLRCLVSGGPHSPADDLAVYLAHSGVAVHRVPDQASAREWFSQCEPGAWVGVIADADPDIALDRALAEFHAACAGRPNLRARFVFIERGRRRGPRAIASDLVGIDRDVMHRQVFLRAVALAAGRASVEVAQESSFESDAMPVALSMQEASAQGRLILVAEDNEINQKVLRQQLSLLGYMADIANNGEEALACFKRRDYPLLLTDLHMPQMDGYELTVAIRAAEAGQRRMPIVALTANALKGEARNCRDIGMDDYMTKPVQLANLKAMLHKWLPAASSSVPLPAPSSAAGSTSTASPPAAAAPTNAANTLTVDVSVLKALVGDEPQMIGELLQEFRVSLDQSRALMNTACQSLQTAEVEALAHKLKSSARSVGALALGELCAQMEDAGCQGQHDIVADLWPKFEAEAAAVNEFLRSAQQ